MKFATKTLLAFLLLVSPALAQWPGCSTTFTCDLSYQGCADCHVLNQWCGSAPQYCAECCMTCPPVGGELWAKNQRIMRQRAIDNPSRLTTGVQLARLVAEQMGLLKPEPKTARVGGFKLPLYHPEIMPKPKPQVTSACIAKITSR